MTIFVFFLFGAVKITKLRLTFTHSAFAWSSRCVSEFLVVFSSSFYFMIKVGQIGEEVGFRGCGVCPAFNAPPLNMIPLR